MSQFSSPTAFLMEDLKLALSGPVENPATSASFQVFLLGDLNGSPGVSLGSGTMLFSGGTGELEGDVSQVFDFSGLDVALSAGQDYYIEVSGGNLMWNTGVPVPGPWGTLGAQLSCDPYQTCGQGLSRYDVLTQGKYYAMQISGEVLPTPEPATWLLLATAVAGAGVLRKRHKSAQA